MSNVNLYNIDKLKKSGINFKLCYIVEFTQCQNVYNNGNIDFDRVVKKEYDNIETAVNFLIELESNKTVLYSQLNVQLSINDMIVLEDCITGTQYTSQECKLLRNIESLKNSYNNEASLFEGFLNKFNANEEYKKFKNEV